MDRWYWGWCGLFVAMVALIFFLPDPTAQQLSNLTNQQLLDMLRSPRAVEREAAAGQLLARSKTIIPTLSAAATTAQESEIPVIMALLQELFLSSDPAVAETAEVTLEELGRQSNTSVADAATSVLKENLMLRHARALAFLRQLGGRMRDSASPMESPRASSPGYDQSWLAQSHVFIFDKQWHGGDDGLKYLLRVFPYESLSLHVTRDAPISEPALQQLRTRRQRVSVRREDESCLGVLVDDTRQPNSTGVRFSQVVTNSPAARAGLRRGDRLVEFNGRPIGTFADLQLCAVSCKPGDRVELKIDRLGLLYHVKLPLGSDFGTGVCGCHEDRPETPNQGAQPIPENG